MSDESKYAWRITVRNTGEILETDPNYTSNDEALLAARKYAIRQIEPEHEITIAILDGEKQVSSETNTVANRWR